MPFVDLTAGYAYYSEQGKGEPLLLLHANPGDSQDYDGVTAALAKHYRVLALDWPGYGQSRVDAGVEAITPQLYTDMLGEFCAALNLSSVMVIANAFAAAVVMQCAIDQPALIKAMVLVSPLGFTEYNKVSKAFYRLQSGRLALSPYRLASRYLSRQNRVVEAMLERAKTVHSSPERLTVNRALWASALLPESDYREKAKNIKRPALVIYGGVDPLLKAKKEQHQIRLSIPAAATMIMPCGHAAFAELPEQFVDLVCPFLDDHSGPDESA